MGMMNAASDHDYYGEYDWPRDHAPARDYLAEAQRIAAGKSMLLPQREHLQACLAEIARLKGAG